MTQNPLTEVIPSRWRRYVYAAGWVAAIGVGAWQGFEGNWPETIASVLTALGFGTAQANTPKESR